MWKKKTRRRKKRSLRYKWEMEATTTPYLGWCRRGYLIWIRKRRERLQGRGRKRKRDSLHYSSNSSNMNTINSNNTINNNSSNTLTINNSNNTSSNTPRQACTTTHTSTMYNNNPQINSLMESRSRIWQRGMTGAWTRSRSWRSRSSSSSSKTQIWSLQIRCSSKESRISDRLRNIHKAKHKYSIKDTEMGMIISYSCRINS